MVAFLYQLDVLKLTLGADGGECGLRGGEKSIRVVPSDADCFAAISREVTSEVTTHIDVFISNASIASTRTRFV